MRVFSFQSAEVVKQIIQHGVYYADISMSRERRSYQDDIQQLGGYNPIWCFTPFKGTEFTQESFLDSTWFNEMARQMSVRELGGLLLLELEVPEEELKIGLTHNDCLSAKVFKVITTDRLVAVYALYNYRCFYHYDLEPILLLGNAPLFPKPFSTMELHEGVWHLLKQGTCRFEYKSSLPSEVSSKSVNLTVGEEYIGKCYIFGGKPDTTVTVPNDDLGTHSMVEIPFEWFDLSSLVETSHRLPEYYSNSEASELLSFLEQEHDPHKANLVEQARALTRSSIFGS